MASGEYVSVKAHVELLEHELDIERGELARRPDLERRELARIYEQRGVDAKVAAEVATQLMRDPELALETHAREELGVDPSALGSPWLAASSSFFAFALGALVPLLPWFFGRGTAATVASVVLAAVGGRGGRAARLLHRTPVAVHASPVSWGSPCSPPPSRSASASSSATGSPDLRPTGVLRLRSPSWLHVGR